MLSSQYQLGFVFNDPLDDLTPLELHRLRHGGWEIDVPLLGTLALYQLHFCWETHLYL